jgi:hypothetical protein
MCRMPAMHGVLKLCEAEVYRARKPDEVPSPPPRVLPERDGAVLKTRFRAAIGVDSKA